MNLDPVQFENFISIFNLSIKIVANGFTGIDVDKMDYFARDSHSVGLPNSFDWRYNEFSLNSNDVFYYTKI